MNNKKRRVEISIYEGDACQLFINFINTPHEPTDIQEFITGVLDAVNEYFDRTKRQQKRAVRRAELKRLFEAQMGTKPHSEENKQAAEAIISFLCGEEAA